MKQREQFASEPSIDLMITSPTISKEMNKQKMSLISDLTMANARRNSI